MQLMMKQKIAQFWIGGESENGVAAVEFAVAGSLVIITILSIVEIMSVLLINVLIEGGVREASRFGITGGEGDIGREARVMEIIGDNTLGLIDMSTATVTTLVYESFADIGQSEDFEDDVIPNGEYDPGETYTDNNGNGQFDADRGIPGLGGDEDIVVYTVEYDWPFLSGVLRPIAGDSIRLSASVPVRNEPYEVQ